MAFINLAMGALGSDFSPSTARIKADLTIMAGI
jgi:hypothetical protein